MSPPKKIRNTETNHHASDHSAVSDHSPSPVMDHKLTIDQSEQSQNHIKKLLEELTRMFKAGQGVRLRRSIAMQELEHYIILLSHPVPFSLYSEILTVLQDVEHVVIKGSYQEKIMHEIKREIEQITKNQLTFKL